MHEGNAPSVSVVPRVLLCGQPAALTLTIDNIDSHEYELNILPVSYPSSDCQRALSVKKDNRTVELTFSPEKEQEYRIIFCRNGSWTAQCSVYAVERDLYELNPYKGDFHMHSNRSDGSEPPAEVAALGRSIGFDIMGLTDHSQYEPSLEAIAAYEGVRLDMCLCPGEEVHPPNNPVHIVNFGGKASVNALLDAPEYQDEVSEIQAGLTELAEGCDPYEYASSLWVFDKIREFGGIGIFCHPYWRDPYPGAPQEFYISEGITTQMFRDRPFDAYEVLGGFLLSDQDSNTLQTTRYYEERLKGPLPIVGVSDAHGCRNELFGWYFTVVFSKTLSLEGVKEGINSCMSVAVEKLPDREYRAYGPTRLVSYVLFLLREYFSVHDALCAEEGQLMLDWINGDKSAADKLYRLSGQTESWLKKCFERE